MLCCQFSNFVIGEVDKYWNWNWSGFGFGVGVGFWILDYGFWIWLDRLEEEKRNGI
jgi:hypothetical protein